MNKNSSKIYILDNTEQNSARIPLEKQNLPSSCPFVRHLILILGTLHLSLIFGCVCCFNPTITVMMDFSSSPLASLTKNGSLTRAVPLADQRFPYSEHQKSWLLAGPYVACLILIGPVGWLMYRLGVWRVQICIGLIVSIATCLIPFAANSSFYAHLLARMLTGLGITNFFPAIGAICTAWAPATEKGTFLAVLSGYIQLSVIISMPLAGFLSETFGWPSVFFTHSGATFFLTLLWAFFYKDNPADHNFIGSKELNLITKSKIEEKTNEKRPPYRQILLSRPVWAIMVAVAGNFVAIQFANTFLPMFLFSALGYSHEDAAVLSAIPLIAQFIIKWFTGFVTDKLGERVSEGVKIRLCNSIAFCGVATSFLACTFFTPDNNTTQRFLILILLCIGIGLLGFNCGGFTKSVVLVSGQFASTVMIGYQATLCLTILCGSFIVPAMTANGGKFEQYRRVFWMYAVVLVLTNVVFVLFAKAKPAKWAKLQEQAENPFDHENR